jgi:hypothetical protein
MLDSNLTTALKYLTLAAVELVQELLVVRLKIQHELFKLISIHCTEFEFEKIPGNKDFVT